MSNEIPKVKDPHFKESFNHFIEQCKQKIDFDRFSITLKHQKQLIIFALLTSEEKTELDCNDSYSLENSSSEKCLSTKKPLKNNILIDNYPENEIFKLSNLKSAILFPLVIHKTPVGTLDIMSFEEDNYSDTDINNIEDLVYTLTLILENYNLQTIIRKSESILTHHPDNLEYLIGNTPDPETPINLDDYIWNLLNSLTDFVIIENASGKIIQVSNKILDLLKYSLDEMKNHEIVYFCTEEDKTKLERLKNLSTEQIINLKTKDNTSIPLNIKSIPINNFDGTYNLTVYKVSEQITSLYDPFSQLEEQFSIIDKDYHIQSVSSEIKDQYGDDLISKKCYLAYNKSSEICANCPIKDNKLSTEILKNHFVFTEFKDGKKVMILFSLIKQKDDSISILETYKDEPFKKSFEEQIEIKPIAEEGESVPDEINQFVDYALNKIKSPASTLDTFINDLRTVPFSDLDKELLLQKLHFMHETNLHLATVIDSARKAFKDKLISITNMFVKKDTAEATIPAVKGKKILVIDSNNKTRRNLNNFLIEIGYQTFLAKDGLEGIMQTKRYLPDMIILDDMMQKVSVFLFVEKIKQHIKKKIPTIFLSENQDPYNIQKAFSVGVVGYLNKSPINFKEVGQLIYDIFNELESSESIIKEIPKAKPKPVKSKTKEIPTMIETIEQEPDFSPQVDEITNIIPKNGVQLSNYGYKIEEIKGGKVIDFGVSEGMTHTIDLDEGIIVFKLEGYLTTNKLEPVIRELIHTINQQTSNNKKVLINLHEVIYPSLEPSVLDLLFSFQDDVTGLKPENIKILTLEDNTNIKNHPMAKRFTICNDMVDAFTQLQMEI